ncbi:MATE family efflux transporter [Bacteroidales bacterium OttesenSCG-928-K03]|nr:MATE family efflux transporter [Odoribacter sp. OttesenSCG-928-L07]MDL2238740.1 MATE family efflux transporter [Bacteroidales bacterium OttesenSCG-928-L14]MDL2240860.1 MATE family efflux transporter [Bacteroidales bacterium OttesenSCG-928-K22]MDL2243106.1 MATE family efflux transporter [Bacteroidales bacterium OttesenSCG-928-K03]
MQRDSLDFKTLPIGKLFVKQLFPTILGMMSTALLTVVDGIFVGRGLGSDALAAVNIAAPIFMIVAGIGLMFGMGGGILVSINLSRGKFKVANINVTQSTVALFFVASIIALLVILFPTQTAVLFGANDYLKEMAGEYMFWYAITLPITVLMIALPFFVRQTNPKFAMWAMITSTAINIVLDYVFIFVFKWGLFGAAIATDIGGLVSAFLLAGYLLNPKIAVRFAKLKMSAHSILLTLRNVWYMIKLGVSTCLSEITIAVMAITGNYVFMHHLGADGVAAYSIICYLFPVIFMVFNAMIQSAQPIISYNYGCGQTERSTKVTRLALTCAFCFGLLITVLFSFFAETIITMFLPDKSSNAYQYALSGLPLFALDYVFFGINVIAIGYYSSVERVKRAITLTVLRGIMPVVFFFILPELFGISGMWLSVGVGDFVITLIIVILFFIDKSRNGNFNKHNK